MRTIALINAPGGASVDSLAAPATVTVEGDTYYLEMTGEVTALLAGRASVYGWVEFDGDDIEILGEAEPPEDE